MSNEDAQMEPLEKILAQSKDHLEKVSKRMEKIIEKMEESVKHDPSVTSFLNKIKAALPAVKNTVGRVEDFLNQAPFFVDQMNSDHVIHECKRLYRNFNRMIRCWTEFENFERDPMSIKLGDYIVRLIDLLDLYMDVHTVDFFAALTSVMSALIISRQQRDLIKATEARIQASNELIKTKEEMKNEMEGFKKRLEEAEERAKEAEKRAKEAHEKVFGTQGAKQAMDKSFDLAKNFKERSESLDKTMKNWIEKLVGVLVLGIVVNFINFVFVYLKVFTATNYVVHLSFSVILVGACVWFAWLSTKQIGHYFRLAEDYAYKATIAEVYAGFRIEAEYSNEGMKEKLLTSAFNRFDESPVRLIEKDNHGSPWHELVSDVVKEILRKAIKDVKEKP